MSLLQEELGPLLAGHRVTSLSLPSPTEYQKPWPLTLNGLSDTAKTLASPQGTLATSSNLQNYIAGWG